MANNSKVNTLVNAGGTVSLAAVVYFMFDKFGNLTPEYQIVVFFGSIVLIVAIAYGAAYVKKKWGIDPSEVVKELMEILAVLQGLETNKPTPTPVPTPTPTPPVDDFKLKVIEAYNKWKGLTGNGAATLSVYDSKILPEIKAAGLTPELLVQVFLPK